VSLAERFAGKFAPEPNTGCWLWTASVNRKGYGRIGVGDAAALAHRVSAYAKMAKARLATLGDLFSRSTVETVGCP